MKNIAAGFCIATGLFFFVSSKLSLSRASSADDKSTTVRQPKGIQSKLFSVGMVLILFGLTLFISGE